MMRVAVKACSILIAVTTVISFSDLRKKLKNNRITHKSAVKNN
jgi:hypothetical protein